MLEGGMTQRQVADALGVNQSIICRAWNRYQMHGNVSRRHGGGRQRSTGQRDDCFLQIQARRHPFATATQLRSELMNASGLNVSTQTIRNRTHGTGLRLESPVSVFLCLENIGDVGISGHNITSTSPYGTGSQYCLRTSRDTVSTSLIVVPRFGESQGSDTMILKSVNMTGTDVGQLWYGVALVWTEKRNDYR